MVRFKKDDMSFDVRCSICQELPSSVNFKKPKYYTGRCGVQSLVCVNLELE